MKSLHEGYTKCNFCVVELKNFEEASKEKEIEMIEQNKTCILVDRSKDKKVIRVN